MKTLYLTGVIPETSERSGRFTVLWGTGIKMCLWESCPVPHSNSKVSFLHWRCMARPTHLLSDV